MCDINCLEFCLHWSVKFHDCSSQKSFSKYCPISRLSQLAEVNRRDILGINTDIAVCAEVYCNIRPQWEVLLQKNSAPRRISWMLFSHCTIHLAIRQSKGIVKGKTAPRTEHRLSVLALVHGSIPRTSKVPANHISCIWWANVKPQDVKHEWYNRPTSQFLHSKGLVIGSGNHCQLGCEASIK